MRIKPQSNMKIHRLRGPSLVANSPSHSDGYMCSGQLLEDEDEDDEFNIPVL
jgi:hypothetical protein